MKELIKQKIALLGKYQIMRKNGIFVPIKELKKLNKEIKILQFKYYKEVYGTMHTQ